MSRFSKPGLFMILLAVLLLAGKLSAAEGDEPLYRAAPHRFEALIPVRTQDDITAYSINLMWINRTRVPGQAYLYPAWDAWSLASRFLDPALKWAKANPQGDVSLWYDGLMTDPQAVDATRVVLQWLLRQDGITNLRLRDIRDLPIVKKNPDAFSDNLPLYFRVDLLKAIFLVHAIEQEHCQAAVYADLEVGDQRPGGVRMDKAELFDTVTLQHLSEAGLLLNLAWSKDVPENQFLEMVNDRRMLGALKTAVINVNLLRAAVALNRKDPGLLCDLGAAPYFSTLFDLHKYYLATARGLPIKVRPDLALGGDATEPWLDYDPRLHGYAPFGLHYVERKLDACFEDPSGALSSRDGVLKYPLAGPWLPAREVHVRHGNGHVTQLWDLVPRPPADGWSYQCELWH